MRPDVTEVDLYSIRELADASTHTPDETWLAALCNPATGIAYRSTLTLLGDIISNMIGSGIVLPDRVYRVGVDIPAGASIGTYTDTDGIEKGYINDPYLDGKVYSVNRRGTELMVKGVEWDNDDADMQVRLLLTDGGDNGDIFSDGEIVILQFQPQISPIIGAPNAIARFTSGIQLLNGDTNLTASTYRKLLVIITRGIMTLGADYPENVLCAFTQNTTGNGQSTIQAPSGQTILYNGAEISSLWVGKNDRVGLVRSGDIWYVAYDSLGYDRIGQIVPGRLPGANQIIAQGQTVLRADYPRLLDYLNRLNTEYPGTVVNSATWPTSKTYWGFGNGTTTLQVPDLRGYFPRWLDLDAGIDADRIIASLQNKPGSPEGQSLQAHNHGLDTRLLTEGVPGAGPGGPTSGSSGVIHFTDSAGGAETRPINAAELPLIHV